MHFREGFTANDREGQGIAAGQDSFSRRSSSRSRFIVNGSYTLVTNLKTNLHGLHVLFTSATCLIVFHQMSAGLW